MLEKTLTFQGVDDTNKFDNDIMNLSAGFTGVTNLLEELKSKLINGKQQNIHPSNKSLYSNKIFIKSNNKSICFCKTPCNIQVVVTVDCSDKGKLDPFFNNINKLFYDLVLTNPLVDRDMPIQINEFNSRIDEIVEIFNFKG